MGFRASIFMAVLSAIFFSLPVFAQKSGTRADTPQSQIPPSGMVLPVQPTGAELQDPTSVIVIDNAVLPPAVDVAPPTPQKQYEVEDAVFVRPDAKGKSSDEALKAAEEARKAEEARQAEEAKRLEAERQKKEAEAKAAEEARKAEEAKKAEEARKAEKAQKDEEARKAEEQKRLEAEQQKQQKADAKKAAEEARKAEKALKAEEAQKAKEARQAEKARKAEEAKQAKEARQAEKARKAEEARQAKQTKTEQPETDKQKEAEKKPETDKQKQDAEQKQIKDEQKRQEAELKRQEADLRRQEAELKRQEADLRQQELEILKQQETDGKVAVAGLSTNLLFDAITAVNLGVEVPIGSRFGLHAGYTFPFWTFPGETVRFNVSAFDLGARVYLHPWETRGYDLYRGWFFTVSAATGKFDLSWNGGGSQGTAIIGAVGGGYTWPVGTWWRLDVSGSAGAMICHFSDGRTSRLPDPAVFKVTMTYLFHYNKK